MTAEYMDILPILAKVADKQSIQNPHLFKQTKPLRLWNTHFAVGLLKVNVSMIGTAAEPKNPTRLPSLDHTAQWKQFNTALH